MSDYEPYYHSYHEFVLNDPKIKKIIARLKAYAPPTSRVGHTLNHDQWRLGLANHPRPNYAAEVIRRNRIDLANGGWPVTSTMNIAAEGALEMYPGPLRLWEEALLLMEDRMLKGYFLGPFDCDRDLPKWLLGGQSPLFHPLFGKYEPKSDGSIKTRLLFNLSDDSNGLSFNDCIPQDEKTVTYITILDVCRRIVDCDMKWVWCLDALEAYYRVPIAARFIPKMGVKICKMLFFFTCLVMGQATACRIYTEFADAVTWIIANNEPELFKWRDSKRAQSETTPPSPELDMIMHYIDDFFGGHTQRKAAEKQFQAVKDWWVRLGIPTQDRKCTPPTQVLKYLGFLFDVHNRSLAVPRDKLKKYNKALRECLNAWTPPSRHSPTKHSRKIKVHQLLQLIGYIRSITLVYPNVVAALRPLEAATAGLDKHHWVRIDKRMRDGLYIVQAALSDAAQGHMPMSWLLHPRNVGDINVYTDASTSIGIGGFEDIVGGRFYGAQWTELKGWGVYQYAPDITYLELLGVVAAAALFADRWTQKVVKLRCDNAAVCMMIRRRAACFRRPDLNDLLLILCEIATTHRFLFWIEHIPGVDNKLADDLSRNNVAAAAARRTKKRLAPLPTDSLAVLNELTTTWRDHAAYVKRAQFAARNCDCDHDDTNSRRQCNRLNKGLPMNPTFLATKGNRKHRRKHLQWK